MYIFYTIFSILYGLYSVMRQWQRYPNHSGLFKQIIVFLLNGLFPVICIPIAIYKKTLIPTITEHRRFMLLLGFKKYRYKK